MRYDGWFIAFPDCESVDSSYRAIRHLSSTVVSHPSGRPWLAGSWAPSELFCIRIGSHMLALLGVSDASKAVLEPRLREIASADGLSELAKSVRGSFHLLGSIRGTIFARGSISGLRRIFCSPCRSTHLVASHANILAKLSKSDLALASLASRLMYPAAPHPLETLPLWQGVIPLPEGSYLTVDPKGNKSVQRWWSPPTPSLSLTEGARNLRSELSKAIELRLQSDVPTSADLSGGLDSTPICFLIAKHSRPFITLTVEGQPDNDDVIWADAAAKHLPLAKREIIGIDQLPLPYDSALLGTALELDEPFVGAMNWKKVSYMADRLRQLNSCLHITGHGGDEVLSAPEGHIFELAWRTPFSGLARLMEYRARRRWPFIATAKRLLQRHSYSEWLTNIARNLTLSRPDSNWPPSTWGHSEPRLPVWATELAQNAVRDLLLTHRNSSPLSEERAQHASVSIAQESGRSNRLVSDIMRSSGIFFAAPFLDDHVFEACCQVRHEERRSARKYKPLITEAMKEIVPKDVLGRKTKPNLMREVNLGRRRNIRDLLALCENSRLASLGLVDQGMFKKACLHLLQDVPEVSLWRTLASEVWVRSFEAQ